MNKKELFELFSEIKYRIKPEEFVSVLEENDLQRIFELDFLKIDERVITEFFNSYFFYAKRLFSEALKSSYSVVEFLIRKQYAKTAKNANLMNSNDLLKWARNRDFISKKNFNYLQGIRDTRNKIVHHLGECLPEEARLALIISTEVLDFFSKK